VRHCYNFIESILIRHKKEAILVGDFNFPCYPCNAAFAKCADVLNGYSIYNSVYCLQVLMYTAM